MEIEKCPFCGKEAGVKKEFLMFGQGSGGYKFWVQCVSGHSAKKFDTYDDSEEVAQDKAIKSWNKRK